jgi:acyl-CoA thioesterase-1
VALLGDSITAGYGLARRDQALPAQLQAELTRVGVAARVVGAGVSGDTTAGGLRRVDRAAPEGTRVCVVALGANDMMNGVAPAKVRANLEGIVRRLKARRITVLLVGMRAAPILDPGYVRAFDAVFPAVAHSEGVALYPFLLDGVAFDARYNQPDRIHPNAAGIRIIAQRLAPWWRGRCAPRPDPLDSPHDPPVRRARDSPDLVEDLEPRQKGVPGARWRPLDTLHLTLRFLRRDATSDGGGPGFRTVHHPGRAV